MSEWQPIETAPQDGTPVLGFWKGDGRHVDERNYALTLFERGTWLDALDSSVEYGDPNHWMPLPEPPK